MLKEDFFMEKRNNLKELALCSVLVSLAAALGMIKLLHLPYGGSITLLSMLAATLCGYYCGLAKGLTAGLALGLLNLVLGGYVVHPAQLILDYILAFTALGLSGLASKWKNGLVLGYIIGVFSRFICSFLSGYIFFAEYAPDGMNPLMYSFVYNFICMGAEAVITIAIISIPAVNNFLVKSKGYIS